MRKYKKKELTNCIDTLQKANGKVLKISSEARVDFLTQCQEMAIMVGTEIDKIEGEGIVTVSYLEQYCEELYLMSVATDRAELIQAQKRINALLLQIKDSIRTDIADSPAEIVFLPYKASMWDALDSVYRAAVQEGNCHVTVMPIPYYNINPQGEILGVEYEGNLFPEDIAIADFRTYNLQEQHPDVIFIHNPYDEYNLVTQVPQEYFSSALVNCTECLVYIPYFVALENSVKPEYCMMPAVKNAHYTFVQSDAVRDCYIKNGADPQKVVAIGSPKFDMVLKLQDNPPAMPECWKSALEGKKVFLLNTHLNPIINEAENAIDKLHQIFELFREREDAALLWRPHPLSIQTAKAMNPQVMEAYMALVEEFKTMSNGVYDETADVHRAIALSDAYIGHISSLVTMYGITGKPIYLIGMRSEANVKSPDKDRYLQFSCGELVGNELWVPAENYNALYKINMDTFEATFVTRFEGEKNRKRLFYKMVRYQDKLFFVPKEADNIIEYSLTTGEQKVHTPNYGELISMTKFFDAFVYGNYLYMFPANSSQVVCLDMDTGELSYDVACCRNMFELETETRTAIFSKGDYKEETAWVASPKTNCILEYHMQNQTYKEHYVGEKLCGFLDVTLCADKKYILCMDGKIIVWNEESNAWNVVWNSDTGLGGYNRICYHGGYIWVLPNKANSIVKIDVVTNQSFELNLPENMEIIDAEWTKTYGYFFEKDNLYLCPAGIAKMIIVNTKTDTVMEKEIQIVGMNPMYELNPYRIEKKNNIYEYVFNENKCPLEYFLNIVVQETDVNTMNRRRIFSKMQSNVENNSGKLIWQQLNKS